MATTKPRKQIPGVEIATPAEARAIFDYQARKLLGIIPFGNRVDRYFDKYRSSQTHISKILGSLANGKDELLMDNAAIDTERANLWKTMHKLEQMIHISRSLDERPTLLANDLLASTIRCPPPGSAVRHA